MKRVEEPLTEEPSRVLMWPAHVLPAEIRRLLTALIGLFAAASLALTLASGHDTGSLLVTVTASLASVAIALWLAWSYNTPRPTGGKAVLLLVAVAALVTAFVPSAQPTTVLATGLPFAFTTAWQRPAWLPLAAALAAIIGSTVLLAAQGAGPFPVTEAIIMVVLLGAATIGFTGVHVGWHMQRQLDQHDADQRDLTLTRERLRFATDLHDIQGHTLLAIKLKAELARRSIDHDPSTARAELHAIENLAAEADHRTRDLAHGYRTLNLTAELANAEQLLSAAGVDVTIRHTGTPPAEHEQAFAALVREAASNILRHTDATTVHIDLTDTTLVIVNDRAASPAAVEPGSGNGLPGLQERFASYGGTVTWQPESARFTLTGEIGTRP